MSGKAREEILARLLDLNHARYAEELAGGLHEETCRPRGRKQGPKSATTAPLFEGIEARDSADDAGSEDEG